MTRSGADRRTSIAPPTSGAASGGPSAAPGRASGVPPADRAAGEAPPPSRPSLPARVLDVALRLAGGLVATLASALFALLAALLVPLRIGPVPIPIAFVLTIVANVVVIRYARQVTGSRLGVIGPCVAWFAVMVTAGQRTIEGDVLVPGDWRGLGLLFVGALSIAVAAYLAVAPTVTVTPIGSLPDPGAAGRPKTR